MSRGETPLWKDRWLAAALALWAAALAGVCLLLLPQWSENPELMHGFLMPVAFILLLREARISRFEAPPLTSVRLSWLCGGLSLAALASAAFGLLYALVFGWSHALSCSPLVLAFACLSLLVILGLASSGRLAFGWPAFCSAALWLLCTPIPPGTYARLSIALQLAVTEVVLQVLGFLGVPAVRHGNVIELVRGSVGVEEACSGIRSLVTCLFGAFLLSAALRMRPWRRVTLILCAPPLAWTLNLLRSLGLALLTASDGRISPAWHDGLGYGALGTATLVLLWLAFRLEEPAQPQPAPSLASKPKGPLPSALIFGCLLPASALTAAFLLLPRQSAAPSTPAPVLEQWLVPEAAGWEVRNGSLPEESRRVLGSPVMLQREYLRGGDNPTTDLVLYVAHWAPGKASPSFVALHTPEVCWPGAGWTELPASPPDEASELAQCEHRRFRHESGLIQEVWYWHFNGGQAMRGLSPYNPPRLIRNALHQGFEPARAQLFIRISANRPWKEIRDSEPVRRLLLSSGISGLSTKP